MIQELQKSFLKHIVFLGIFGLLVFGNMLSAQTVERVCFDMQTNQEYDCSNPPPSSNTRQSSTGGLVSCGTAGADPDTCIPSGIPSSSNTTGQFFNERSLNGGNSEINTTGEFINSDSLNGGTSGNIGPSGPSGSGPASGPSGSGPASGPSGSGGSGCQPGQLCNPLESDSIPAFLLKIIDVILVFALPIIIIYIMYAGFLLVTSQGNPSEIETARSALLWAVIGGVVILGARLIIEVIQGTIEAF